MISLYLLIWSLVGFGIAMLLNHPPINMEFRPFWLKAVAALLTGPVVWVIAGYFIWYEWYLDRKYNRMFALLKLQKESMDAYYKENP